MKKRLSLFAGCLITTAAFASTAGTGAIVSLWGIVSTIVYSAIGIIMALVAYKVYDLITPFDLNKEIEEDQNIAVGLVVAGMIIGISIIIAAAIL